MIPTPRRTLRPGDRGLDVVDAQRMLGLPHRMQGGYFGPIMQRALEDFQDRHGLQVTGEVDAATWEALERRWG